MVRIKILYSSLYSLCLVEFKHAVGYQNENKMMHEQKNNNYEHYVGSKLL